MIQYAKKSMFSCGRNHTMNRNTICFSHLCLNPPSRFIQSHQDVYLKTIFIHLTPL